MWYVSGGNFCLFLKCDKLVIVWGLFVKKCGLK